MQTRQKAATLTVGLNLLLTVLKFILFAVSGSIAVFAEAWHSFTDIATSLLVLIAVSSDKDAEADGAGGKPRWSLDQKAALVIGLFLLLISIFLFYQVFSAGRREVQKPIVAGVVFIVFALGSYFVYRFETGIGEATGSFGLMADGNHAKADMTASLLTGFSLIMYALGVNIDRWVGGLITIFVFSFAVETLVNVIVLRARRQEQFEIYYRSYRILAALIDPGRLRSGLRYIDQAFGLNLSSSFLVKRMGRIVAVLLVIAVAGAWLSTCVYMVGISQEAILERFGRTMNPGAAIQPGLHFKLPWPVDNAIVIDSRPIRSLNVGNVTDARSFALLWTMQHGTEEPFISGDNNFFYPYLVIHFRVNDVFKYYYNLANQAEVIDNVAHTSITRIFAGITFFDLVTSQRGEIEAIIFQQLQEDLDGLETGIELVEVNFKDIHPPIFIADSYERVIAAMQEKEEQINIGHGYRNKALPETRGQATREEEAARAYVSEKIDKAEGDASRFLAKWETYQMSPDIIEYVVYLSTMKEILAPVSKVLVDPLAGTPQLWMDFERLGMQKEDLYRSEF
ncbi:protease modulator HflK family protein [bacterium]|nr:protease modulator HflK family protein [candidate division CSSED10-310 bacterium]